MSAYVKIEAPNMNSIVARHHWSLAFNVDTDRDRPDSAARCGRLKRSSVAGPRPSGGSVAARRGEPPAVNGSRGLNTRSFAGAVALPAKGGTVNGTLSGGGRRGKE